MDDIRKTELRKLAEKILSGGRQAVEQFSYGDYSEEELNFILQEMDAENAGELDSFMTKLDAKHGAC